MKDFTNGLFKLPSREERIAARAGAPLNPFKLAMMLSPMQGAMFFSGWLAWTMDAWDFFSVSLGLTAIGKTLGTPGAPISASTLSTSITLTLLFRPLGAAIFGLLSDRYGRKWPLVANLIIIAALSLGSGKVETLAAFLGVRCLFGIGMGGIWGMATATALENMPAAARGLFSGILQQGYAVGYLLAASVNISLVPQKGAEGWRVLFYLGAGLSLFAALVRALLPESELYLRLKKERAERGNLGGTSKAKTFVNELGHMLRSHWGRCIFGVLLMTGFNFLSHSSQDLYPTIIQKVKFADLPAKAPHYASLATIVANCGAICGGLIAGYLSQYLGRRLTIIIFVILTGTLIPAWILPNSFSGLAAGAFFIQFGVQGAWGVVPIYLSEISPPAFRATFAGVAYQLGNMVSAASAQIEARGGESLQIPNPLAGEKGQPNTIPDYATVSGILLGVVCAYLLLIIVFGREYRGAEFEKVAPPVVPGAGHVDTADVTPAKHVFDHGDVEKGSNNSTRSSIEHVGDRQLSSGAGNGQDAGDTTKKA